MLGVGDVTGDGDDAVDASDGALERSTVARVDGQLPAALGQRAGERESEPARCAGHDSAPHYAATGGRPRPATRRS